MGRAQAPVNHAHCARVAHDDARGMNACVRPVNTGVPALENHVVGDGERITAHGLGRSHMTFLGIW
jgi:hypothetical protein